MHLGEAFDADGDERRSRETEARLLAVIPAILPSPSLAVRMVTPVANRPRSCRKTAPINVGDDQRTILARKPGCSTSRAGSEVAGHADQGVRQSAALQPLHSAIEQRWQQHGIPDEAFDGPLSGERPPACSNVPAKSVRGDLAGTMQRFRGCVRRHLGTSERGVDAFAGEGIEEVGRVADEERAVGRRLGRTMRRRVR